MDYDVTMKPADELKAALDKYRDWPPFDFEVELVSVTQADGSGDTVLHHAARRGDVGDIKVFLAHGGEIDRPGDMGLTPLHYAAGRGRLEAVRLLLEAGARTDIVSEFGDTAAGSARSLALSKHGQDAAPLLEAARLIDAQMSDRRSSGS